MEGVLEGDGLLCGAWAEASPERKWGPGHGLGPGGVGGGAERPPS